MPLANDEEMPFCFGVLGPVQVRRRSTELDPGARQQRLILALLLADAGQPVGIAEIIQALWGKRPPASAANVVHRYVGALRRLFEPGLPVRAAGRWLMSDAAGYRMRVDSSNLDLLRFRELVGRAQADERADGPPRRCRPTKRPSACGGGRAGEPPN